jgi:hypothetical protein
MAESRGRAGAARRGPNWVGLAMAMVFLVVASAGFTDDPFWLFNQSAKWMIAGLVALVGVGMLASAIPRSRKTTRS